MAYFKIKTGFLNPKKKLGVTEEVLYGLNKCIGAASNGFPKGLIEIEPLKLGNIFLMKPNAKFSGRPYYDVLKSELDHKLSARFRKKLDADEKILLFSIFHTGVCDTSSASHYGQWCIEGCSGFAKKIEEHHWNEEQINEEVKHANSASDLGKHLIDTTKTIKFIVARLFGLKPDCPYRCILSADWASRDLATSFCQGHRKLLEEFLKEPTRREHIETIKAGDFIKSFNWYDLVYKDW